MKNKINAIIIDDSRLARVELKHLLSTFENIKVVAESGKPLEAIDLINQQQPDVIFLDIQMPIMDGFELLGQLDYLPEVVFVTAFDEFAIKAFEHNAIDYLQKPIEPQALLRAVNKLEKNVQYTSSAKSPKVIDRVFVKEGENFWFVELTKIRYFEVDGNYTTLYFDQSHPMIPKTLNYLEKRLDENLFFRANRNQIINTKHITKIEPWIQGFRVILSCGEKIELSRRQTQKFKELMSF
jgi:two-component system LytT family response regulator